MNIELKTLAVNQSSLFSVFANPKRIMILWTLAEQERSVGEIATAIDASLQCTSQHLHLMKDIGILDSRRDGQTIYYHIVNNELNKRCQLLFQAYQNGL